MHSGNMHSGSILCMPGGGHKLLLEGAFCVGSTLWLNKANWHTFGEELLIRFTIICSLCIMTICYSSYQPLWFRGRDLGLHQFLVISYLYFSVTVIELFCTQ